VIATSTASGRIVTVVVSNRDGEVLGQLDPFEVETPWWQETEPVQRRFPELAVLRLIAAEPSPGAHDRGGTVTYLAELRGTGAPRRLELRPCDVTVDDHPLRMPWACPGSPDDDLEWASGFVRPTGPPIQHRTWNLSALWSFPTSAGRVWLKCVPPFFAHEAAVLRLLAAAREDGRAGPAGATPKVMAAAGHRILLAGMPGRDGFHAPLGESKRLVDLLVGLQAATADRQGELRSAGVPDARWPALLDELEALVARRAPENRHLRALLEEGTARAAAIDDCGLPEALVHGDAHPGNARVGTEPPVWFDWGDSRIGNPLLDLAVLERAPAGERAALERHWLAAWRRARPGSEPERAWRLLRPLAVLRTAAVYQGFLDHIEPSERVYHEGDVAPALARASRLAAGSAGKMQP